ncbi:MAG: DUF3830 family protein [Candidatus Aminicenantes bacterium]|nr:DUF3830 family protein [Candidatus Aminicenantes bacterium]
MARYIEITLKKRGISCVARLLDEKAPRTCEAVWNALPQQGEVYHAKYASNEIYILVPGFAPEEPGPENCSMVPAAGDVMYFTLGPGLQLPVRSDSGAPVIDLAVFYDRDNLLLSPKMGPTPGNVFATIIKNRDGIRDGGNSVWREGAVGEMLCYSRLEGDALRAWGIEP